MRRTPGARHMSSNESNRRAVLAGTTALTAATLLPRNAVAQGASAGSLPARGEFVIRGAHVLSMAAAVGDVETGAVHVRDGVLVAVGASVNAPGAQAIGGKGR